MKSSFALIIIKCLIGITGSGLIVGCQTNDDAEKDSTESDSGAETSDSTDTSSNDTEESGSSAEDSDTGDTDENIIDSNGVEWVFLEGDTFKMGIEGETGMSPVVEVTIQDFYMMKTEATVGMYKACMADGSCSEPDKTDRCNPEDGKTDYTNWEKEGRDDYPISCISWNQAFDFCEWLGGRLPSESEWEFAARSRGKDNTYPWGEEAPSCERVVMEYLMPGCGEGHSWEVCSLPLGNTEQGICDMAGNVAEIVHDWLAVSFENLPDDGSPFVGSGYPSKGARGGNMASGKDSEFITQRRPTEILDGADHATWAVGVRCAR